MEESEIRPEKLFNEFLRLSHEDTKVFFPEKCRVSVPCPACCQTKKQFVFNKGGFDYAQCVDCDTLYLSPRPTRDKFEKFYSDSISARFWADEFFPVVAEKRKEKIIKPNVDKIRTICNQRGIKVKTIVDIGAGYGHFLEEWKKIDPDAQAIAVEPSPKLSKICQSKGIRVIQSIAEKAEVLEKKADLVVCFEVIEHVHNPCHFLSVIKNMLAPGGIVIVTGLGVDGFDIQILWENSKSISPPHHINFMSVDGFEQLFRRVGFSDVEVTTPGNLDVDIVLNNHTSLAIENRFFNTLSDRGEEALGEFQNFLTKYQLSSHCWVSASCDRR